MSTKVGIGLILKQHFSTYKNERDERSYFDWLLMVVMPLFVAMGVTIFGGKISVGFYSNIVTAGAIFTGLLLNLLVLVYDQKTKIIELNIKGDDKRYIKYALRKRIIDEVHYNISYCILICLLSIVISTIASSMVDNKAVVINLNSVDFSSWIVDFPLVFLGVHLILTILMILKRVHKLISSH